MKQLLSTLILLALVTTACTSKKQEKPMPKTEPTNQTSEQINEQTLTSELNAKKESFNQRASDDIKKKYAEGIASVEEQGVTSKALQVGDKAIDFTLHNATGEAVSLYSELKKGPVVLMWYRGGWCPYCNLTLHYMQEALPEIKAQGANLLALTPELPDSTLSTSEKNDLDFQVLSDIDNKVGLEYNVVFKLTEDVANSYEQSFKLSEYNGNTNNELPLAATYIIDTDGTIVYAFLDEDYRNRAEPTVIINELKKLKADK